MEDGNKTTLVFPPLALGRRMLERASSLFGPPGLCIPWYMDVPTEKGKDISPSAYCILRPPEELRPPKDFPKLLQEYLVWMKDHSDRSAFSFLSAVRGIREPEETRWEIQKMLRKGSSIHMVEQENNEAMKWHLILHLAAQLERERQDVENSLRESAHQGSPLKDALGEGADVPDFMDDLSPSLIQPVSDHGLLEDICEAWLGLFGKLFQGKSILLTFREDIYSFVKGLFEETVSDFNMIKELPQASVSLGDPLFPVSRKAGREEDDLKKNVRSVLHELTKELHHEDGKMQGKPRDLLHSLQEMLPPEENFHSVRIEILSLPDITNLQPMQGKVILNGFSGNILMFLGVNSKKR